MAKQAGIMILCHVRFSPFALSVSKGIVWFDKLTTNGIGMPAIRKDDKVQIIQHVMSWMRGEYALLEDNSVTGAL